MTRPHADEHPSCKNESGMFKVSIPNWGDWEYHSEWGWRKGDADWERVGSILKEQPWLIHDRPPKPEEKKQEFYKEYAERRVEKEKMYKERWGFAENDRPQHQTTHVSRLRTTKGAKGHFVSDIGTEFRRLPPSS